MLASVYTDDFERGNAMGIALGGLALGVLSKETLLPTGFTPTASPELCQTSPTAPTCLPVPLPRWHPRARLSCPPPSLRSLPMATARGTRHLPTTFTEHPPGHSEKTPRAGAERCFPGRRGRWHCHCVTQPFPRSRGPLWQRDVRVRGEILSVPGPGLPRPLRWR